MATYEVGIEETNSLMPSDSGTFEIHVRLKNFGQLPVSARIESNCRTCSSRYASRNLDDVRTSKRATRAGSGLRSVFSYMCAEQ